METQKGKEVGSRLRLAPRGEVLDPPLDLSPSTLHAPEEVPVGPAYRSSLSLETRATSFLFLITQESELFLALQAGHPG